MRHFKLLLPAVFALAIVALPALPGCSSQETRTTTTQADPNNPGSTTTTTTTTEDHDSLLGATGHFVWTVIALPFRIVGDVLGEIV